MRPAGGARRRQGPRLRDLQGGGGGERRQDEVPGEGKRGKDAAGCGGIGLGFWNWKRDFWHASERDGDRCARMLVCPSPPPPGTARMPTHPPPAVLHACRPSRSRAAPSR